MQCLVLSKHHGYTSSTLKRALQDLDLNNKSTYSLDISNIKLDPTHAKIIFRLSLSSIITAINLEHTVYPPTHLVSFLQHNPLLRYLNIKGNHYNTVDKLKLAKALFQSNLQFLITDHFSINSKSNSYDITNELFPEDSAMLIAVSKTSHTMQLQHRSIRVAGSKMLRRILSSSFCVLTNLNLSNSSIGNEGAIVLAQGIMENSTVTMLNLSGKKTGISFEGMHALTCALSSSPRIATFVLYFSGWKSTTTRSPKNENHQRLYLASLGKSINTLSRLDLPATCLCELDDARAKTCDLLILLLKKRTILHLCFRASDSDINNNCCTKIITELKKSRVEVLQVGCMNVFERFKHCFDTDLVLDVSTSVMDLLNKLPLPSDVIGVVADYAKILRVVKKAEPEEQKRNKNCSRRKHNHNKK